MLRVYAQHWKTEQNRTALLVLSKEQNRNNLCTQKSYGICFSQHFLLAECFFDVPNSKETEWKQK